MATPKTKLFVGHLPEECTSEELQELFEKYGTVTECDVLNKYGFVHMSTSEEADDALKALNNYNLKGCSISVEHSRSKLHPEPGAPGRAKAGTMPRRGMPFGPGRGGFENGYRRYDGPPSYPPSRSGDYYDRGYGGMMGRMRPYPMPYDRRPLMAPMRDEYYRSPYASRDPYARPVPSASQADMYERRAASYPTASDYLYSRRSPTASGSQASRAYWYGSSGADAYGRYTYPKAYYETQTNAQSATTESF